MEEAVMRVLMRHDGSMTIALAALFDCEVKVSVLSEVTGDDVLVRHSVLSANDHKLLYAVSEWKLDTYDHYMKQTPHKAIGEVLSGLRVEQFREMIHQEQSVVQATIYETLGIPETPLYWRRYNIFSNGLELCQVTEYFSSSLLNPLIRA